MLKFERTNEKRGERNEGDVNVSPQLLTAEDVPGAEEGDAGEPQVLVQHEHTHWDEVWVAQVVDEAADISVVASVDAIHLPVLYEKHKEHVLERNQSSCKLRGPNTFSYPKSNTFLSSI